MKTFFGTCVDNPFGILSRLCQVIDNARTISKRTFLRHCFVEPEIVADFERFPYDYEFFSNRGIYFYTWSAIEHFYK